MLDISKNFQIVDSVVFNPGYHTKPLNIVFCSKVKTHDDSMCLIRSSIEHEHLNPRKNSVPCHMELLGFNFRPENKGDFDSKQIIQCVFGTKIKHIEGEADDINNNMSKEFYRIIENIVSSFK